jgi:hypothetical protein
MHMKFHSLWAACSPFIALLACAGNSTSPSSDQSDVRGAALFRGAGASGAGEPLAAEIDPETAHDCVPVGIGAALPAAGAPVTTCFFNDMDPVTPAAIVEHRIEVVNDARWIHVRLTFNPDFVDNSYGENAIGWGDVTVDVPPAPGMDPMKAPKPKKQKGGHTFKDLVGSDHAELQMYDSSGELITQFKLDYLSEVDGLASGYGCAGVTGGEGKMIVGEPEWILGATSSMDRNLNGCGGTDYLEDSPATDENYTPNPDASYWDYRVVYEAWVAEAPFEANGLGNVLLEFVHASPSKAESDTQTVTPGECPPAIDPPPVVTTVPPTTPPVDAGTTPDADPPPVYSGTLIPPVL